MEDLLASIRKAINEDSATKGTGSGTSGISGSMRELRVRVDEPVKPEGPQSEILELRNRIAGQLAERAPASPPARPRGFAGILSGDFGLPASPARSEPQQPKIEEKPTMIQNSPLRQSYAVAEPEPASAEQLPENEQQFSDSAGAALSDNETDSDEEGNYEPASYRRSWEERESERQAPALPEPRRHGRASQDAGMLSPEAAAGAEAAFGRLADSLMNRALGDRPIQDITRELLRSMLKQWLDAHLPALVERLVREEIERVARRGGR